MPHKNRHLDGLLSPYEKIKPILLRSRPKVTLFKYSEIKRLNWQKLVIWWKFLARWKNNIQVGGQVDVKVVSGQLSASLNPGRAQLVAPQPWTKRFYRSIKKKISFR